MALHQLRNWLRYRVGIWGDGPGVRRPRRQHPLLSLAQGWRIRQRRYGTDVQRHPGHFTPPATMAAAKQAKPTGAPTTASLSTGAKRRYTRRRETTAEAGNGAAGHGAGGHGNRRRRSSAWRAAANGQRHPCGGRFHQLESGATTPTRAATKERMVTGRQVLLGWKYTATTIGLRLIGRTTSWLTLVVNLGARHRRSTVGAKVLTAAPTTGWKVVKAKVMGDPESYTANTISFDPADDVLDSANGDGLRAPKRRSSSPAPPEHSTTAGTCPAT